MRIEGLNGTNTQIGVMNKPLATDSVSKNIQDRIANAQKQLQELSASKDISIEEKMQKRQEIQQQIADLNNQLRQHQIEMRRQQQQEKSSSMDEMLGNNRVVSRAGKQSAGLSQASMQAIISADSAISQAQSQGSVSKKMEGRAGVLEAEIKLDSSRGANVEAKQEELAEVQEKMSMAESAQINVLADAKKELDAAAKEEQAREETSKADKKDSVADKDNKDNIDTEGTKVENVLGLDAANVSVSIPETNAYSHVDVRL